MRRALLSLSFNLLLAPGLLPAADPDAWRSPEEIQAALESLVSASGGAAVLEKLAVTREGRVVSLLTLALPSSLPAAGRPSILLVANLEGRLHAASELALDVAAEILRRRDEPETRALLERTALHVVALASPDAAARRFRRPLEESSRTTRPRDDDRDGRMDEDGPEDLDGDGEILWMRIPDPDGPWVIDGADARVLRPAADSPGTAARFRLVSEGVDSDGDGAVNEDPPGGIDLSRSFPHEREEAAPDTGPYPASEPEARALLELLIQRPEVQLVLAHGARDNLLAPPEQRDGPPQLRGEHRLARADGALHARIAEKYRALTGKKEAPGGPPPRGSLLETAYFDFGLPALGVSVLVEPLPDAPPADSDALRPWRPYDHPTLGAVHIGGWRPFRRGHLSREETRARAAAESQLVLWLLGSLARVELDGWRVDDRGGGLFEVRARIANRGELPTGCAQGVFTGRRAPLGASLTGEGLRTIDSGPRQRLDALAGGASRELRWTVIGKPGARVELEARLRSLVLVKRSLELRAGGSL
jgi:hypothetical protein